MLHTLKSYAKLNLYLKVFLPRLDGLHPIRSLFQTISLHDTLTIKKTDSSILKIRSNNHALERDNLLHDIYNAYRDDIPFGIELDLYKRIPLGGGLGGGSSNAACFLSYLNKEAGWNLDDETLIKRSMQFGSDIAFFIKGGTALVQGIGEIITDSPPTPYTHFILINPNRHSDTGQVYRDVDNAGILSDYNGGEPKFGQNDLKDLVFKRIPELIELELFCQENNLGELYMSGSGSSCFLASISNKESYIFKDILQNKFPLYFINVYTAVFA